MFRTYNESDPVSINYDNAVLIHGDDPIPTTFFYRHSFIADTYRNSQLLPTDDELSDVFQAFGI